MEFLEFIFAAAAAAFKIAGGHPLHLIHQAYLHFNDSGYPMMIMNQAQDMIMFGAQQLLEASSSDVMNQAQDMVGFAAQQIEWGFFFRRILKIRSISHQRYLMIIIAIIILNSSYKYTIILL